MTDSLYERLGGTKGINSIAKDLVDNHLANPLIATRFKNASKNRDALIAGAATFFIQGTGGPEVYEGKDMITVHKGMNISGEEFVAALDDALDALEKNKVGQREQEEVLFVLFSMRRDVMSQ